MFSVSRKSLCSYATLEQPWVDVHQNTWEVIALKVSDTMSDTIRRRSPSLFVLIHRNIFKAAYFKPVLESYV